MVELTLRWNHVKDVLGPNGNISYPAQLLPMMIGALSFLRILWLLFQRLRNPSVDSYDGNEATQQKVGGSSGASTDNPRAGLGLLHYSPATNAVIEGEDYDDSLALNRSPIERYTVAYLPWMSQFEFWKNPKGHRRVPSSTVEEGGRGGGGINNYHDSPMTTMRTSYKSNGDADLPFGSGPSSTDTSPMIDMKSPTSVNNSPVMAMRRYE